MIQKRTASIYINKSNYRHKIFDKMSSECKSVYNHMIFTISFYEYYKKYLLLSYPDIDDAYQFYTTNYKLRTNNTKIIYDHIKKINPLVYNDNIVDLSIKYLKILSKDKSIDFDDTNKIFVLIHPIRELLMARYVSNFYKVRNCLLHKKPVTDSDVFINHVKTNKTHIQENNLFGEYKQEKKLISKIVKKKLIKKKKVDDDNEIIDNTNDGVDNEPNENVKGTSKQNIIKKLALKTYIERHLPGDIIGNLLNKTYQSYKSYIALLLKGLKPNQPKYLKKRCKICNTFLLSFI